MNLNPDTQLFAFRVKTTRHVDQGKTRSNTTSDLEPRSEDQAETYNLYLKRSAFFSLSDKHWFEIIRASGVAVPSVWYLGIRRAHILCLVFIFIFQIIFYSLFSSDSFHFSRVEIPDPSVSGDRDRPGGPAFPNAD